MSKAKKAARNRGARQSDKIHFLNQSLANNAMASQEGPSRKHWTRFDLRTIKPLTPTQTDMFHAAYNGKHICAAGSAGTGKTYISMFLAFELLFEKKNGYNKIIIVRSAQPTKEVGYLPGTLEEKMAVYESPYVDIAHDLFNRKSTYQDMKQAGIVEFMPTSFIRGLTWDNAIVIVDEGQNMTFHEISSIVTRVGKNSRLFFTGDLVQTDLRSGKEKTGMADFLNVIKEMDSFESVEFNRYDIVRSNFVKSWIIACEELGLGG